MSHHPLPTKITVSTLLIPKIPVKRSTALTVIAPLLVALPLVLSPTPAVASYEPVTCSGIRSSGASEDIVAACRDNTLKEDFGKSTSDFVGFSAGPTATTTTVVPLDDVYQNETRSLDQAIRAYGALEPFAASRPIQQKALRVDMNSWVGRYAKGGSARSQVRDGERER